jgi:hypothetical protein
VVPIEVKSGKAAANSMNAVIKKYDEIALGYQFVDGNIGTADNGVIPLPLYMVAFI